MRISGSGRQKRLTKRHRFTGRAAWPTVAMTAALAVQAMTAPAAPADSSDVVPAGLMVGVVVTVPGTATAGRPVSVTVTARDRNGNIAASYNGTLTFASQSDPAALLPPSSPLTNGVGAFSVTFNTTGYQIITAIADGNFAGTSSLVSVSAPGVGGRPLPMRLFGVDRFGTAIAVSKSANVYPGVGRAVVLAKAGDYPDALVGSVLSAAKEAPLLFVQGGSLTAATQAEIQRVLATSGTVYVLGDTTSVPESVTTTLTGLGYTVVRYAGADRYATALAVAEGLGVRAPFCWPPGSTSPTRSPPAQRPRTSAASSCSPTARVFLRPSSTT